MIKIDQIRKYIEIAYFFAGIIGIPLILLQMLNGAKANQVAHTLSYVERFSNAPYNEHKKNLLVPWFEYSNQLRKINDKGGLTRSDIDLLTSAILAQNSNSNTLSFALIETADFFDQLSICIEKELCQRKIAKEYFADFSSQFHCVYGTALEEMRVFLQTPSLGNGLSSVMYENSCAIVAN